MTDDTDRRGQILRAALDQFAEHGFRGATIKGIARAAGLQSPALIYWYFPTKEALFQSVIERHLPFLQLMTDPAPLLERPPQEVLPAIARTYLASFEQPLTRRVARLVLPEMLRRPDLAEAIGGRFVGRVLGFLSTYLSHQVALKRLRPHDVRSSSRAFIGMLAPQALLTAALPALNEADGLTNEEHIATAVQIFLGGLSIDDQDVRESKPGGRMQ
jgi:TetR/AcrR family transcriptional regulator